jgi:O-antigen ligase
LLAAIFLLGFALILLGVFKRGFLLVLLAIFAIAPASFSEQDVILLPWLGAVTPETLIALCLMGLMVVRAVVGERPKGIKISSIWLSWVFIGLSFISAIIMTALGIPNGLRMLERVLFPLLVFLFLVLDAPDEQSMSGILYVLLGTGILLSMAELIYYFMGGQLWSWSAGVDRFIGFTSVSIHAYTMAVLTVISYVLFRVRRNLLFLVLVGIFGLQVVLTVTRGAIFSTALSIMAFELFGRKEGIAGRFFFVALFITGLFCAVLFYAPLRERIFATQYREVRQQSGMTRAEQFDKAFEKSGREGLWSFILTRIGKDYHLVFGYGVGSAEVDVMKSAGGVPHNEYLRVLYEMGIVGLLLFVAFLWQLWGIARHGARSADNQTKEVLAGTAVGLITLFACGSLVDNMISKYKLMGFAIYMFVAFILLIKARESEGQLSESSTKITQKIENMASDGQPPLLGRPFS